MTHLPTSIREFASIEELDELPRELGWPLEYRQIEPGPFSSTFTGVDGDTWFLLEEQSSRSVEVVAGAPFGMVMMALAEGVPGAVNGKALTGDHLFFQASGSDFRAILPGGIRVTQIGIAEELFEGMINAVAPNLQIPRGGVEMFALAPGRLEGVRWAMREAILAPSSREATRNESASRILAELVSIAFDQGRLRIVPGLHRAAASRTLAKAREYIEGRLGEAIRVESVCRYAGTSIRSLERIFAREMGVAPQQYVMARRLNAVRRRLLAADKEPNLIVTEAAQDHGFAHMGRFAGQYRRYFGETPGETLRLSQ